MFIDVVPNRKSRPAILLRESYRDGKKVRKRTVANLSSLPIEQVGSLRRLLRGERLAPVDELFDAIASPHHGHVQAVLDAMKQLGFVRIIATRPSRERDLVVAMVAIRILKPCSKLGMTRSWHTTTLPEILGVTDADEDELYDAMDWLLERQEGVEKKLAARHLKKGGLVLYDLSSSYFEGVTCPLAAFGHNRDGKKGKLQVNYGLLTDDRGCPVAVSVYEGNTADSKTLMPQIEMMKNRFGFDTIALVGDRGMISQKQIDDDLRDLEGVDWITALKSPSIRKLMGGGHLQLDLFDERNLFELTHPDYPSERLVACRNPALAKLRAHKRRSLLKATSQELEKIRAMVERGKLKGESKIATRAGKIINKKLAEHFTLNITSDVFDFHVADEDAAAKAVLDGIFKKLAKVRSEVEDAKLEGSKKIAVRVGKIINKDLAKRFTFNISDDAFSFQVDSQDVAAEAALNSVLGKLERLRLDVQQGKYGGKGNIGVRVGKVLNRHNIGKHFVLEIRDDGLDFHIDEEKVAAEAALDGIYVIRTSLPEERLSADDTVRSYKSLSQVERAFRSIKTMDLQLRPIRHRLESRVRSHIFLCMLAYYVEWHMREAWRPLLFCDEDQEAKKTRDPVAPAKRSEAALRKVRSKKLDDETEAHSFQTLLDLLSTIVRNVCRVPGANSAASTFHVLTTPNPKQQRAYDLLAKISV